MSSLVLGDPARQTAVPALDPDVCQVWWASVDDLRPGHDGLLSPGELDRRDRFVRSADRQRSTTAAALVRIVLGEHARLPPRRLTVDRTCPGCGAAHGKPRVRNSPDLHFSVSHSAGCVAVAVLRGRPVGIDVEELGGPGDEELESLADQVLSPSERAELRRYPAGDRAHAFMTYWTRKEAVVKATGDGLAASLDAVVVSAPSHAPSLLRWTGRPGPVSLHALHPPPGTVGALAVLGAAPARVVELDAGPLLRTLAPG